MGNKAATQSQNVDQTQSQNDEKSDEAEEKIEEIKGEIKKKFKLICAIDFGTDGVGLAYGTPNQYTYKMYNPFDDDEKQQEQKYNNNNNDDNDDDDEMKIYQHEWPDDENYGKKKAYILLDKNNELFMFGKQAVSTYECMRNNKGFKLFERFKMNLYRDPRWKKGNNAVYDHSLTEIYYDDDNNHDENKNDNDNIKRSLLSNNDNNNNNKYDRKHSYSKQNRVNLCKQIQDKNDTPYSTEDVFVETLKYLREEAMKYIHGNLKMEDIEKDDIQWILTIPAIWSDTAKHCMKAWAIKADLINPNISNQLRMALEPEAAALDVQYLISKKQYKKFRILSSPSYSSNNNKNDNKTEIKLNSGDKYILIDAGGGTVDIVSHEIIHTFGVREIVDVKGGAYSSSQIDQEIMKIFNEIFGKDNMNLFKKQQNQMWVMLLENIAVARNSFQELPNKQWHAILLPQPFVNFMEKQHNTNDLEQQISQIKQLSNCYDNKLLVKLTTDYLYIKMSVWKEIFDKCIQRIVEDCAYILEKDVMNNGECKYIFMVGGLSQNCYFQDEMIEMFGPESDYKITIILPINGILSVVCGAARFGINPYFVQSRILNRTYCIEGAMNKMDVKNNEKTMNLSKDFIKKHTFTTSNGVEMVRGIFDRRQCFAIRGEEVLLNKLWTQCQYRDSKETKEVEIVIYCGKENIEIPQTINDAYKLGKCHLKFPDNYEDLCIIVEFSFYDTILTVYAYPRNKSNMKEYCPIIYHSNHME